MQTEELKILLALEPTWTVSLNGLEFQTLRAADIHIDKEDICAGKWSRKIHSVEWLRPNVVRVHGRQKFRAKPDQLVFYPGDCLPSGVDLRRRRRLFQVQLGRALVEHFKTRSVERQTLYSDRSHGIGGAYPRFIVGNRAIIAVDPDEGATTVNAIMRAALMWSPLVHKRVCVVIPKYRGQTIKNRLAVLDALRQRFDWLEWDGEYIRPLSIDEGQGNETEVRPFRSPAAASEVATILNQMPFPLQAVPQVATNSVSIRFKGVEVACVRDGQINYPFGEPLHRVITDLDAVRRHGSSHPLARAYEERWLESNIVGQMGTLLPSINAEHIYPQVPSFVGEERNIIDLLTVTTKGRLVVMEIKASADPDLPFQALDYWIAVERHRKNQDFQRKGYFTGVMLEDDEALLVLVAPLLAFHRTLDRLLSVFPPEVPLLKIGLNQAWKREMKVLRRQGPLG